MPTGTRRSPDIFIDVTTRGADKTGLTDSLPALQAIIAGLDPVIGDAELHFPFGDYRIDDHWQINRSNVQLSGGGTWLEFSAVAGGSRLLAGAAIAGNSLLTLNGETCGVEGMRFDGQGLATAALALNNGGHRISNCMMQGGTSYGFYHTGNRTWVSNCRVAQNMVGEAIRVIGPDNIFTGCRFTGGDTTSLHVMPFGTSAALDNQFVGCHITGRATMAGPCAIIESTNTMMTNCMFDTSAHELLKITSASSTVLARVDAVLVVGCNFLNLEAGGTAPAIWLDTSIVDAVQMAVHGVTITGNVFHRIGDPTHYTYALSLGADPTYADGITFCGNTMQHCDAAWDSRPTVAHGNLLATAAGGAVLKPHEGQGVATKNGVGPGTTQFTIAHGLWGAPTWATVTPGSADAATDYYVSYDATNITVTYLVAPPIGVGNVVLNWSAGL